MEFAIGILAALIGAAGLFAGTWLSGRHERQREHERWNRTRLDARDDARATAITALTENFAQASHAIEWFTWSAQYRPQLFSEQAIIDYDAEMRIHLVAIEKGLVAVAHRDEDAFHALVGFAEEVWTLDGAVGIAASSYWTHPEDARTEIATHFRTAANLVVALPGRIAEVLAAR